MIQSPETARAPARLRFRFVWRMSFLAMLFLCSNGCETMQWLAPHQLWKLNRQPPLGTDEAYFSIPAQPKTDNSPGALERSR